MNSDLQHLIKLQDLDLAAERAHRRIADLPGAQQALEARIADRTAAVAAIKERMAAGQAARREIDKTLAVIQGRLSKYKEQLMEVKTNKEYQAMQKEMAVAEREVRSHEDRILERMEEAEVLAAELKTAESSLSAERADVARDQQALDAERKALEGQIEQLTAERLTVVSGLSRPAIALFEQLAQRRKGHAMSEARNGLCMECHVKLRPQIFNEARRNDSLIQCDNCSRILYFIPTAAPGATAQPS
jgi:predicted  nucleic acid-binding Zn-ribbon protein